MDERQEEIREEAEAVLEEEAAENTVPENGEEAKENEEKKPLGDFLDVCESVITSVFVVLLIFTFVCRPVTVEGDSMNHTLYDGDVLIMSMMGYTPKNGDIIILNNEKSYKYNEYGEIVSDDNGLQKKLIKRVIATGGQTVDIDTENCTVTVDGVTLSEDYIAEPTAKDYGVFDYPVTVPEGYIFVMGDNRNESADSRDPHVGFVKEEDVTGKAVLRFYPFEDFEALS